MKQAQKPTSPTSTVVVQYQYWYWTVLGVVLSSLGGWPLGDHSKKILLIDIPAVSNVR